MASTLRANLDGVDEELREDRDQDGQDGHVPSRGSGAVTFMYPRVYFMSDSLCNQNDFIVHVQVARPAAGSGLSHQSSVPR